jgi:hypothetical protein
VNYGGNEEFWNGNNLGGKPSRRRYGGEEENGGLVSVVNSAGFGERQKEEDYALKVDDF